MKNEQTAQLTSCSGGSTKPIVRRSVSLKLSLEDAETLLAFIQGSVECADDNNFLKFGRKMMKKLKPSIDKHYA